MENKESEPAFPIEEMQKNIDGTGISELKPHLGMSKRFYAACAAMQGMLANRDLQISIYRDAGSTAFNPDKLNPDQFLIKNCYNYADELLRQENL